MCDLSLIVPASAYTRAFPTEEDQLQLLALSRTIAPPMKLSYLAFTITASLLFASCIGDAVVGHGRMKTETVQLSSTDFDKIKISAPVDAHITVGGQPSLSFEGYANLLPYLHTEVRNGVLRIFVDDVTELHAGKNIVANISLPSLTALDLSGSSDAVVSGAINAQDFELDVSGAASVDINEVHVQRFSADMSGSADLTLQHGDINTGSFEVSGNGAIKAFGVSQQRTTLELTGSADAEVNVTSDLEVDISGAGSVVYKGHPRIAQEISGAGSIRDGN